MSTRRPDGRSRNTKQSTRSPVSTPSCGRQRGTFEKTATKDSGTNRRWFINSQGQTFVLVNGPMDSLMGDKHSLVGDKHSLMGGKRRPNRAASAYRFAIATHEVTVAQFLTFTASYVQIRRYAPEPDCPATTVTWFAAAAYCNWLSRQEGIPKEEWCYELNEKGDYAAGMKIPANFVQRKGYRLPTETEWEDVCRANTDTSFSFGEPLELLQRYGWYQDNSHSRTWPIGSLRPNALGVFDMHGNVAEWCQNGLQPNAKRASSESETIKSDLERVLRGGAFNDNPDLSVPHTAATPYRPSMATTSVSARLERSPELLCCSTSFGTQPTAAYKFRGAKRGFLARPASKRGAV